MKSSMTTKMAAKNWKLLKFFNYDFTRIMMAVDFFWVFILENEYFAWY